MSGARKATRLPFYRMVLRRWRSPITAFEEAARRADGEIVRLDLGPFRPYLVTHPDHVQHMLRQAQPNYERKGLFWDQLIPVVGEGILSEGEIWRESKQILQPLFTAKHVESLGDRMAEIIEKMIDATVVPGVPFDLARGVAGIVQPTIVRLFFGDRISSEDIRRLMPAYDAAITAQWIRLLLPSAPRGFPLPGDRAFRRAVRTVNEVVLPRVREARSAEDDHWNVVSALCRARSGEPEEIGDRKVRNDLVSMHGASTETSTTALTWALVALHEHQEVAERVFEELDLVVGGDRVTTAHLPRLRYLKMFLQEVLRLYPPGWLMPRRTVAADTVHGVAVDAGTTVVISPYLTHRMEAFWDRPLEFDPERFAPENEVRRHRYAYFPFAAGPHKCLGQHLFMMEGLLFLASLLSRHRPVVNTEGPITPRLAAGLRTDRPVSMTMLKRVS